MEKVRVRHGEPSGTFCVAWGCSNRQKTGDGRKFHRFPKDVLRREKWVAALKRDGFEATDHSRICSDHFEKESYNQSGRMKDTAFPTIFNFPDHMRLTAPKTRKTPVSRVCMSETMVTATTSSSANKPASPQPEPGTSHMIEDHGYCLSSPLKTRCKMDKLEGYVLSYKKKIKIEKQRNRRLAARVVSLTDIVNDLRKKVGHAVSWTEGGRSQETGQ